MSLNPVLLTELESYGLTNEYLEQLLAVCKHHYGRVTWNIHHEGFSKVEVTLFASMQDSRRMRTLTQLLQKEH